MAKIWLAYEGDSGTHGEPIAEKPLRWCIETLRLTSRDWKCMLGNPPRFVSYRPALDPYRAPIAVIIEVDSFDVIGFDGWQAGYYIPPLHPEVVQQILGSRGRAPRPS